MVMLHKSLFASKWMQALHFALGDSFSAGSAFALLYVMYNPVCRSDIHRKKMIANKMLAEALHPVQLEYSDKPKRLGFHIKSFWAVLNFSFKNRALADCNPTLVLSASKHSHATIFKDLNSMSMLVKNNRRDARSNWKAAKDQVSSKLKIMKVLRNLQGFKTQVAPPVLPVLPDSNNGDKSHESAPSDTSDTWIQRFRKFWARSNRIAPSSQPDNVERYDEAPKAFVDQFAFKRSFLEENIEQETRLSLLTLIIFPDDEDFGTSRDCKRYKQRFDENLKEFKKAFRSLFLLSKDLEFCEQLLKNSNKIAFL